MAGQAFRPQLERPKFGLLSGLSHDPVLRDIFTPLSVGATIVLPPKDSGRPEFWRPGCGASKSPSAVSPALGQMIAAAAGDGELKSLRTVFWGGDMLSSALVRKFHEFAGRATQVNFYGSTETPQAVAFMSATPTRTGRTWLRSPWIGCPGLRAGADR